MKKLVAKNEKEVEKYRQKLFKAKEAYRKEQAKLPFEKKIEIVMELNRFASQGVEVGLRAPEGDLFGKGHPLNSRGRSGLVLEVRQH